MKEKRPVGYVVFHKGVREIVAFDIFVGSDIAEKYKKDFSFLYNVNCPVASKFEKEHEGYEFIGSEDFGHEESINSSLRVMLQDLKAEGFEFVFVDIDREKIEL